METIRTYRWFIYTVWMIALLTLAVALTANAQVTVNIEVEDISRNRLRKVMVNVYQKNALISTDFHRKSRFDIVLDTGQHYTIEIAKKHFIPKRISVNTCVDAAEDAEFYYPLIVFLELRSEYEIIEDYEDYTDYPVALIFYDEDRKRFTFSRLYRQEVKEDRETLQEKLRQMRELFTPAAT